MTLPRPAQLKHHQYIDRTTGKVITERLSHDSLIRILYSAVREKAPLLFRLLTSPRMSSILAYWYFDFKGRNRRGCRKIIRELKIDLSECCQPPGHFRNLRTIFERQIRYWEKRPLPPDETTVVSPADARTLIGSLNPASMFFIKDKFFTLEEMLGENKNALVQSFADGDFAIFRLTPDKYHYNHCPVSGKVSQIYELDGQNHSCNPYTAITSVTPYAKNRRVITIIDTDIEHGSWVGKVAMIEIVALMIGDIQQAYSRTEYESPVHIQKGMFLKRGQPKSLYRPGSSVDVLLFEKKRVRFAQDLLINSTRRDVMSRFSVGIGKPMVETDVAVRSEIGKSNTNMRNSSNHPRKEIHHG